MSAVEMKKWLSLSYIYMTEESDDSENPAGFSCLTISPSACDAEKWILEHSLVCRVQDL